MKFQVSYKGVIDNNFVVNIIGVLHKNKKNLKLSSSVYHRLASICIETLQNISKYANQKVITPCGSEFFLDITPKSIVIKTKNVLTKSDMEYISGIVDDIKRRNIEEIQNKYRMLISSSHQNHNSSAGLGLYDIALNSQCAFDYSFEAINENHFYISFSTEIPIAA